MSTDSTSRRSDDRHILDVLYRRYHRRLKRRLQRRFGNPHDAEDCLHEAFTRAAESGALPNVRWLRAYINRIVRNLRTEVVRYNRREREVLTVSSALAEHAAEYCYEPPLPDMPDAACELDLTTIIMHLPGRRGRVFRLSLEGYKYCEIALQLGISESVVGQDLMHARQEVEEMLEPRGGAADEDTH